MMSCGQHPSSNSVRHPPLLCHVQGEGKGALVTESGGQSEES